MTEQIAFIGYITNNAFPQPLSEEDEAYCLNRMQLGDQDAKNTIIEHNLRLVAHICKKFEGTGEDNDDLISIGTIGLIKAINTFDPAKGTKLATYAARCIENEILMHLRSIKKLRGEVSLYDPIGVDKEGNELTCASYLQDGSPPFFPLACLDTFDDRPVDPLLASILFIFSQMFRPKYTDGGAPNLQFPRLLFFHSIITR